MPRGGRRPWPERPPSLDAWRAIGEDRHGHTHAVLHGRSLRANNPSRKGFERGIEAAADPFAQLAGNRAVRIAGQGRDAPVPAHCWPSRTGLMDRERPQARVGWKCTSRPPPCPTRHPQGGVAPVIGLKARKASVLLRTPHNPKAIYNFRNRRHARPKRIFVHIDPDVNVRLWVATERAEDRLQVTLFRA